MTGLLIIDIQNFYEKMLDNFEETCKNANKILQEFRKNNQPVFFIQHIKNIPLINKVIPPEKIKELQIHESVKPLQNEPIIKKYFINSYRETDLLKLLEEKNIKELVICGMMTHMCVDAAVRASNDFGFKVTVISDACTTKNLKYKKEIIKTKDVHNAMLSAFEFGYAKVKNTDEFIKNF